ncbi:MAG: MgtC/SapB family protein [Trueperaceae bacterium]
MDFNLPSEPAAIIWSLLVATLLGFLIGLERERKRETQGSIFAGIRTFPLISLYGAVIGQLVDIAGPILLLAAFLALAVLVALAYWRETSGEKIGGTTEVAVLLAFGLGVMAGVDLIVPALAGGVIATGVLSLRPELRRLSAAATRQDLFAVVQFAAVSLVVLPLVPDEPFGPWGVWNPRTIWLLVVLISGVSFVGYVLSKAIGARRGIGLSGILGGLASSTAVTLSFSENSKRRPELSSVYVVGVLAASTIMAPRLLALLGLVQPQLVLPSLLPLAAIFLVSGVGAIISLRRSAHTEVGGAKIGNPFELKTALQFALLFAIVLVIARAAQEYLGTTGVYLASVIAGITQLDAITLSLATQVSTGLDPTVAARGLALAVAANSLFKAGLALSLGSRDFGRGVLVTLILAAAAGVAVAFLVPLPLG